MAIKVSWETSTTVSQSSLAKSTLRNWSWCRDVNNADRSIDSCTEFIRSGGESTENLARAHYNRGSAYRIKGEFAAAISDLDRAIDLKPDYLRAINNRGILHYQRGDYERAMADFNRAIDVDFNFTQALYNRGLTHSVLGDYDRAIADYDRAIAINRNYANAYNNRGDAYARKGEFERAITDYDRAIELNPSDAVAFANRGLAYASMGKFELALGDTERAVELNPVNPSHLNALAWTLATAPTAGVRDGVRAVELAERADSLEHDHPGHLDTLAAAYAEADRFDDAVRTQQRAIDLLRRRGSKFDTSELLERLRLYKDTKPFRQ